MYVTLYVKLYQFPILRYHHIQGANREKIALGMTEMRRDTKHAGCIWCLRPACEQSTAMCKSTHKRWMHTRQAWMLFSYSFSCLEQKVFLLVAFDPTEMPYICQRKGDPMGPYNSPICMTSSARSVLPPFSLLLWPSPSLPSSCSYSYTHSLSPPSFPSFPHFFHVPLSCVCLVHNYLLCRSAAKAPFDFFI